MDVIEDINNILHWILNYLGIDVQTIVQHMQNVSIVLWRHHLEIRRRRLIYRKSFIRTIANYLPLKPAPRLRLQADLLRYSNYFPVRRNWGAYSSTGNSTSSQSLESLVWCEEDLGNDKLLVRRFQSHRPNYQDEEMGKEEKTRLDLTRCTTAIDNVTFSIEHTSAIHHELETLSCLTKRTSTPLSNGPDLSSDPAAMVKISALEEELVKLREQIAQLVMAQENTSRIMQDTNSSLCRSGLVTTSEVPVAMFSFPPPPPPLSLLPPPPPPPPLPPMPTGLIVPVKTQTSNISLVELLQQKKSCLSSGNSSNGEKRTSQSGVPSLSDVLKNLDKVKLRSIKRSPGGTPCRRPPKSNGTDPASIIAQALKKKFAYRQILSPEGDKENEFDSQEDSPKTQFGQHLLKKTQRRIVLVDPKETKSRAVTSPIIAAGILKERN